MHWLAAYDEAKTMREIIAAIAGVVDEGNFYVKEEGLEFMAMDESRVAMVMLRMPSTVFHKYEFEPPEGSDTLIIGVNFSELKKIMQRGKAKDSIIFSIARERGKSFFAVTFFRGTPDERTLQRTFALPIIEIPEERISIKELQYDVSIEFAPASFLNDIIAEAKIMGEDLRLVTKSDTKEITFLAESETGGYYEYTAPLEKEDTIVQWEIKNDAEALYSIDFLRKFVRASKVADMVRIEYSRNMPLKMTFVIGGGTELIYLLAPRIL